MSNSAKKPLLIAVIAVVSAIILGQIIAGIGSPDDKATLQESEANPAIVAVPSLSGIAGPGIPSLGPHPSQVEIPGPISISDVPKPGGPTQPDVQQSTAAKPNLNCTMHARLINGTDPQRVEIGIFGVFAGGVSFVRMDWGSSTTFRQVDATDGSSILVVTQPDSKTKRVSVAIASDPSFGGDALLCAKNLDIR